MSERSRGIELEGGRPTEAEKDSWAYLAWCPNCGQHLEKVQCKARCFRCGFFQDCGDTII